MQLILCKLQCVPSRLFVKILTCVLMPSKCLSHQGHDGLYLNCPLACIAALPPRHHMHAQLLSAPALHDATRYVASCVDVPLLCAICQRMEYLEQIETTRFTYPWHSCLCRTTIFSNYARANCPADDAQLPTLCTGAGGAPADAAPRGGPWWSLMFEISESELKPVNWTEKVAIGGQEWPRVVLETLQGAVNTQLLNESDEVVSIYYRRCARALALLPRCALQSLVFDGWWQAIRGHPCQPQRHQDRGTKSKVCVRHLHSPVLYRPQTRARTLAVPPHASVANQASCALNI